MALPIGNNTVFQYVNDVFLIKTRLQTLLVLNVCHIYGVDDIIVISVLVKSRFYYDTFNT